MTACWPATRSTQSATNLKAYVTDSWFQPLVKNRSSGGITIVLSVVAPSSLLHHQGARRPARERGMERSGLDENEHGEVAIMAELDRLEIHTRATQVARRYLSLNPNIH